VEIMKNNGSDLGRKLFLKIKGSVISESEQDPDTGLNCTPLKLWERGLSRRSAEVWSLRELPA